MGNFDASTVAVRSHLQKMIGAISASDPDWLKLAKWYEIKGCSDAMVLTKTMADMDARRYGKLCQRNITELHQRLNKTTSRF